MGRRYTAYAKALGYDETMKRPIQNIDCTGTSVTLTLARGLYRYKYIQAFSTRKVKDYELTLRSKKTVK